MDPITRQAIAVAGGASGGDPLYVDDVFSTSTHEGNNGTTTVNNGIDLSGEGGLVWIKQRDDTRNHRLGDTERGTTKYLISNSNIAETTNTNIITSYNNNGFTLGTHAQVNEASHTYVSWAFRKAPGFFDIQTFTASPGTNTISHSLGSTPGMMIVKNTSLAENWYTWHRSIPNNAMSFNSANGTGSYNAAYVWGNASSVVQPTSTQFTMYNANSTSQTFVVYLFAHDDQSFGTDSDEAIVKCGSYTGNGSTTGPVIDLGFEPQWLLVKLSSTNGGYWVMLDNMRGVNADGGTSILYANDSSAEVTSTFASFSSTGFQPRTGSNYMNSSGQTYVYMAIRRPHKPPTAGTEVFKPLTRTGTESAGFITGVGFAPDFLWNKERPSQSVSDVLFYDKLRSPSKYIKSTGTSIESSGNSAPLLFTNDGLELTTGVRANGSGRAQIDYYFRRAPGFFDVVAYTGDGSATRQISHNLEATPELIIVKSRSNTSQWLVWSTSFGQGIIGNYMTLNSNGARSNTNPPIFTTSAPTSTYFNVAYDSGFNVQYVPNVSSYTYIAYLFATLDGISKVSTYSGTGSNINVDCGFTAGARFVLIKRTDSSGDWYVWDTARGIVSGNDPYYLANSGNAEVTNTDYIDPLNAGFTVTSSAPAALNASGGTYLFLAIA